ncbi:glycosyl transferase [Cryobacterium sp. LW097]|uniref:glycosyltransferase n=1 Tax=unclassified Cryobacterium TaxID=2649013 RepID=UPI000B4D526E|nr:MULTISPECIES: glycosyltransferase [unclassified Cryobacterium]ASD21083.1 glycosyl transferase [Cryobacterium sp. LW097]TFC55109.1 glycosyltransferase [Cryobacterium sp. TMB3-1-2]TFC67163.1 glycosyltransferase [Cryobacterium sp. TMB3-15]TFC73324.1 glycosyltransferase [Cryobacterium sp. TMB3-10]TFD44279.1 glycosyltransferase [Cryobacterium sp. TMB3-12]
MPSVVIIGTRGYPSYYGGFETAVRRLAPYLAEQGWDVTVYGRHGSTRSSDPDVDTRVRSVVTRGLERKSLSTLSYGLTACLDAAKRKPDVALVMNVANGFWLPILKARGIPTLINVDGIEWDRAKWGRLAKWMFRTGAKLTARFGTRLVYDSRVIAQRWNQDFGTDGVFIPYGGAVPPELPIEPGLTHRGYVLVVARFVPENTIPEFLDAAESIAQTHDVVIVGSEGYGGPLDKKAQLLAQSNERITWLGHVSDDRRLFSLWQHAGVYFHGHSVGGTNPALVQAMACGAPTVARDTEYNREVLGSSGLFVRPTSTDIEQAVLGAMADSQWQINAIEHGRRQVAEIYTWEKVCQAYEDNLRALFQAEPGAGSARHRVDSVLGRKS